MNNEEIKKPTLHPILYWDEVWEILTKYLPDGESEEQRALIDAIEEENYEVYPTKYPEPFWGAYQIAKALNL
jgi:hypothetical protein